MNKVLVLCQRKTGKLNIENSENVSKQINPALEEFVSVSINKIDVTLNQFLENL